MRSLATRLIRVANEQLPIRALNASNEGNPSFLPFTALTFCSGRKRWFTEFSFSTNVGLPSYNKEDHDRETITSIRYEYY